MRRRQIEWEVAGASTIAHLERTVQELDGVVLDQQKRIESLERKLESLTGALHSLRAPEQERKPEDEKPPHY